MKIHDHLCRKYTQASDCSVFIPPTQKNGRWLADIGKCQYTLRPDYYCPFYPHAPPLHQTINLKSINFKHAYHKLNHPSFTTIRGKTLYNSVEVGSTLRIHLARQFFCYAHITKKELKPIKDMALVFLKQDAEYPGFTIYSHEEFIALLNSFNPPFYPQATLMSEKTIIYLEKW